MWRPRPTAIMALRLPIKQKSESGPGRCILNTLSHNVWSPKVPSYFGPTTIKFYHLHGLTERNKAQSRNKVNSIR